MKYFILVTILIISSAIALETTDEPNCGGPPRCDKTFTYDESSGHFTDGSGEKADYENDQNLCFLVKPNQIPNKCRVKLWFKRIDVEEDYDFIRVYDAKSKACLDDIADTGVTYYSADGFLVNMVTDFSVVKKGFGASFAVEAEEGQPPSTDFINFELFESENHKRHHTERYEGKGRLYLRRGEYAEIALSGRTKCKHLRFDLKGTPTRSTFNLQCPGEKNGWKCEYQNNRMRINSPVNAAVGIYDVDAIMADGTVIGDDASIYLFFNPYNTNDETYMKDERARREYLENDKGILFTGQYGKGFNYGFYDAAVVKASMHVLDGLSEKDRRDVVAVARYISWRANNVVLHGRWDGEYSDGATPGSWSDAGKILTQWHTSGNRVKYGQCWVFSGVVLTCSRAIGIPNRSVTNINSAHERKPFDRKCHEYWKQDGNKMRRDSSKSADSVWNFHVWNEAMIARKDLNLPAGWNAYDGTCQEMSGGRCQCGPYPVAQLRNDVFNKDYDGMFIAGETNCDIYEMHKRTGDSDYKLVEVDKCRVGSKTLTKQIGSNRGEDVSLHYKKDEDCRRGRRRFWGSLVEEYEWEVKPKKSVGSLQFEATFPPKAVPLENSIDMGLKVSGAKDEVISAHFEVEAIDYRGNLLTDKAALQKKAGGKVKSPVQGKKNIAAKAIPSIWEHDEIMKITGGSGKVSKSVPVSKYLPLLGRTVSFRISVTGTVTKNGKVTGVFARSKQISLAPAKLRFIEQPNMRVGEVGEAKIQWTNQLPIAVKNAKLGYTISGSGRGKFEVVEKEIAPGQSAVFKIKVKTCHPGKAQISAVMDSDNLIDVVGMLEFEVKPAQKKSSSQKRRKGKTTGRIKVGVKKSDVGRKSGAKKTVTKLRVGRIGKAKASNGKITHLQANSVSTSTKLKTIKGKGGKNNKGKVKVGKNKKNSQQKKKKAPKKKSQQKKKKVAPKKKSQQKKKKVAPKKKKAAQQKKKTNRQQRNKRNPKAKRR